MPDQVRHDRIQNLVSTVSVVVGLVVFILSIITHPSTPPPLEGGGLGEGEGIWDISGWKLIIALNFQLLRLVRGKY